MRILVSGNTKTTGQLALKWPSYLGLLTTPMNRNSIGSKAWSRLPIAIDNGAFSPGGFDEKKFVQLLRKAEANGDGRILWAVAPDVVGNAAATYRMFPWWALEIRAHRLPVAFVLQDGQDGLPLPDADCYFIGGSTAFKLSEAACDLASEAKRRGKLLHMGRCNSIRRLEYAYHLGCDSVDGSGYSRFGDAAKKDRGVCILERHLQVLRSLEPQPTLF